MLGVLIFFYWSSSQIHFKCDVKKKNPKIQLWKLNVAHSKMSCQACCVIPSFLTLARHNVHFPWDTVAVFNYVCNSFCKWNLYSTFSDWINNILLWAVSAVIFYHRCCLPKWLKVPLCFVRSVNLSYIIAWGISFVITTTFLLQSSGEVLLSSY